MILARMGVLECTHTDLHGPCPLFEGNCFCIKFCMEDCLHKCLHSAAACAGRRSGTCKLASAPSLTRRYVLKNLVRDWGPEGAAERSQSYDRICTELAARLGQPGHDQPVPRVLVPGAGLGRLCLDIGALGYHAQVIFSPFDTRLAF